MTTEVGRGSFTDQDKRLEEQAKEHDSLKGRVLTLEIYFKVALALVAVFGLGGAFLFTKLSVAQDQVTALDAKIKALDPVVKAHIERINTEGARVTQEVRLKAEDFLQAPLESRLQKLGAGREGVTLRVTNRLMGGAAAGCSPGHFVTEITASKGVGGKYAGDGISELTVICAPLL